MKASDIRELAAKLTRFDFLRDAVDRLTRMAAESRTDSLSINFELEPEPNKRYGKTTTLGVSYEDIREALIESYQKKLNALRSDLDAAGVILEDAPVKTDLVDTF